MPEKHIFCQWGWETCTIGSVLYSHVRWIRIKYVAVESQFEWSPIIKAILSGVTKGKFRADYYHAGDKTSDNLCLHSMRSFLSVPEMLRCQGISGPLVWTPLCIWSASVKGQKYSTCLCWLRIYTRNFKDRPKDQLITFNFKQALAIILVWIVNRNQADMYLPHSFFTSFTKPLVINNVVWACSIIRSKVQ